MRGEVLTSKEDEPETILSYAVWWLHSVWMNDVTAVSILNCYRKNTSFDENTFVPPPLREMRELHQSLMSAGQIEGATTPEELVCPPKENVPV